MMLTWMQRAGVLMALFVMVLTGTAMTARAQNGAGDDNRAVTSSDSTSSYRSEMKEQRMTGERRMTDRSGATMMQHRHEMMMQERERMMSDREVLDECRKMLREHRSMMGESGTGSGMGGGMMGKSGMGSGMGGGMMGESGMMGGGMQCRCGGCCCCGMGSGRGGYGGMGGGGYDQEMMMRHHRMMQQRMMQRESMMDRGCGPVMHHDQLMRRDRMMYEDRGWGRSGRGYEGRSWYGREHYGRMGRSGYGTDAYNRWKEPWTWRPHGRHGTAMWDSSDEWRDQPVTAPESFPKDTKVSRVEVPGGSDYVFTGKDLDGIKGQIQKWSDMCGGATGRNGVRSSATDDGKCVDYAIRYDDMDWQLDEVAGELGQ